MKRKIKVVDLSDKDTKECNATVEPKVEYEEPKVEYEVEVHDANEPGKNEFIDPKEETDRISELAEPRDIDDAIDESLHAEYRCFNKDVDDIRNTIAKTREWQRKMNWDKKQSLISKLDDLSRKLRDTTLLLDANDTDEVDRLKGPDIIERKLYGVLKDINKLVSESESMLSTSEVLHNRERLDNVSNRYQQINDKLEKKPIRKSVPTRDEILNSKELVNHPSHYNQYDIEVIDMIEKIWGTEFAMNWCKGNAFKYRMRAGYKDDFTVDLEKEQWYLNKAFELKNKLYREI